MCATTPGLMLHSSTELIIRLMRLELVNEINNVMGVAECCRPMFFNVLDHWLQSLDQWLQYLLEFTKKVLVCDLSDYVSFYYPYPTFWRGGVGER